MSDEQVDRDVAAGLSGLWETPVGRRWLLKAGIGSAAAVGAQLYAGPAVAAAQRLRTDIPTGELQFALGALPGVSDLTLVANGQRIPLQRHTSASRAALRRQAPVWRRVDLSVLTHYVSGVKLPDHRAMPVSVLGRRGPRDVVVSQLWHVPAAATIALATVAHRLTGNASDAIGGSARLRRLGIDSAGSLTPTDVALLDTVGDSQQTAILMTKMHPNIATIMPAEAAITKSLLASAPEVQTLGNTIAQLQRAGQDYATFVTAVDAGGKPAMIEFPVTGGPPITKPFQTFQLNDSAPGLSRALTASVVAGIRGVRDNVQLGTTIDQPLVNEKLRSANTWVQPVGVLPQAHPYTNPLTAGGIDVRVNNTGLNSGTYVTAGKYADGQVPLTLYNNYLRWASVYVQYLGKDGTNLSANPNPTGGDTKYAQYLGMLPQVFTVLGIPIWDSNTITVTLTFPPEAHVARLLLCGLGASNQDGAWHQYFPPDAYRNHTAPTDEVLVPALLTGILTIGLSAFALLLDIPVAGVWSTVTSELDEALKDETLLNNILDALLRGSLVSFTSAEAGALATAVGEAMPTPQSPSLAKILAGFASVIAKTIFSPSSATLIFRAIATSIAKVETAQAVLDAIPFVGQVLAVIAAVGDAVTLAEAVGETLASPWVIENEVSLTYPTTVKISRDSRASTWPVTARSWRLEALVEGALVLDPITGLINGGGKTDSDPLKLNVTAPFGGQQIQWSFVALDASGRQVATGVSATYPNDDPTKPASDVSFAITQLPATITASTVFHRAATSTYDTKAGGYSWSDQVNVPGTVQSANAQHVAGAAVATLAGVAGMVFKQNDRYYLRGVPLAQDGATIKLGVAPTEGYARRPFLLLDPFVDKADQGNHVLLEPDDTSDAYHVRRLTLDTATGALSWDGRTSYGTLVLEPSAAALHSSGKLVAVHTDSGRLGWLSPVNTSEPALATYSAGPGTQPGLLSSPIAVAVTNPGVVLVLEAGTSQISAFDLNGNPVRYFPANSGGGQPRFRRGLASAGTPLDLAVDGADQIYVLYFTGTGSAPSDYHVDVYTRSGDVLDTHSPGVNVGRLAVDYWRSIYGANYDALTDLGTTTPRIDPRLNVAEPSLSRFDPITPPESPRAVAAPTRSGRGR